jgi:hypothetical protein
VKFATDPALADERLAHCPAPASILRAQSLYFILMPGCA